MDKILQRVGLAAGQGGVDDVVGLVGICAEAGRIGCAAHQLAHDKITDGLPVVADDEDGLEMCIRDSIYCLKKLVNMIHLLS